MNLKFEVRTTILDASTIQQETTAIWGAQTDVIGRQVASLQDAGFREALIKLGWTPPKDAEVRDES